MAATPATRIQDLSRATTPGLRPSSSSNAGPRALNPCLAGSTSSSLNSGVMQRQRAFSAKGSIVGRSDATLVVDGGYLAPAA